MVERERVPGDHCQCRSHNQRQPCVKECCVSRPTETGPNTKLTSSSVESIANRLPKQFRPSPFLSPILYDVNESCTRHWGHLWGSCADQKPQHKHDPVRWPDVYATHASAEIATVLSVPVTKIVMRCPYTISAASNYRSKTRRPNPHERRINFSCLHLLSTTPQQST